MIEDILQASKKETKLNKGIKTMFTLGFSLVTLYDRRQ